MKSILLVGAGWANLSFLYHIDSKKYQVKIIDPNLHFNCTPLLVQNIFNPLITSKFSIQNTIAEKKVLPLSSFVKKVDFEKQKVYTNANTNANTSLQETKYDYIIFGHGANVNTFNIPGMDDYSLHVKTQEDLINIQNKINSTDFSKPINIAIIGTGPTGVELMGHFMDMKKTYPHINLYAFDGLSKPLIHSPESVSNIIVNKWNKNQVNVFMNSFVSKITPSKIYLKDKTIPYDMAFWCGGIKINPLSKIINTTLKNDHKLGIPVNQFLEIENTKNAYAIGDCSYSSFAPTAQVAVQQGKYLAEQFNNDFKSKTPFSYKHKGQLCYLGNQQTIYFYKHFYIPNIHLFTPFIFSFHSFSLDQAKIIFKDQVKEK